MINYKNSFLMLCALLAFSGCGEDEVKKAPLKEKAPKIENKVIEVEVEQEVVVQKEYSLDEIYNEMCISCHSSDGSGNTEKLTPSMIGNTLEEIRFALEAVENDDGHIIMEHNREQILKKGMVYSAEDMSEYMYNRFTEDINK